MAPRLVPGTAQEPRIPLQLTSVRSEGLIDLLLSHLYREPRETRAGDKCSIAWMWGWSWAPSHTIPRAHSNTRILRPKHTHTKIKT